MLRIDDIPQQVADDIHAFGVIWYATVQTQAKSGKNIFFIVLSQKVQVKRLGLLFFREKMAVRKMDSHPRVLRRLENIVAIHRLRKSPPLQTPYFLRALRPKQLSTVCGLAHLPPLPKNSTSFDLSNFLFKPQAWYGITRQRVWYRRRRMASPKVHFLRLDSIPSCNGFHTMLCIDSIHAFRRDVAHEFKSILKQRKVYFLSVLHKKSKSKGLDFCFFIWTFSYYKLISSPYLSPYNRQKVLKRLFIYDIIVIQ